METELVSAPPLIPDQQLAQEIRRIAVFKDLTDETVEWIISHLSQRSFAEGEVLSEEGSAADKMVIIFDGEIRAKQEKGASDGRTYSARAGMVVGLLPFSRLDVYPLTARAVSPTRVGYIVKEDFPEMIATMPVLVSRLVGVMADRIRETTVEHQQRDKLISLGRLSAGLAHELNNPSSAAQRSAESLREAMQEMRQANLRLQARELSPDQRQFLAHVEAEWDEASCQKPELSSLERCDLEDSFSEWLGAHGVENGWMLAPSLVEASCDLVVLDKMAQRFEGAALADALAKLAASFAISRLVGEIENATKRISSLVRAVKEYSYMDQAPEQEIDVHRALDSTLQIMDHRIVGRVEVRREYDPSLPPICAFGSELNQVWTNLIDNAIDAMEGNGEGVPRVLTLHTSREYTRLKVEICDTGKGIPTNIENRIFDPFFTTKKVGAGTGLGLDTVFRIVKKHDGEVKFESKPGDTRFSVYLPFLRGKLDFERNV